MRFFQLIILVLLIYELDLRFSNGDTSFNSIYEDTLNMENEILLDFSSIDKLLDERQEKFKLFIQNYVHNNLPWYAVIRDSIIEFWKVYNPNKMQEIPSKDFQLAYIQLKKKLDFQQGKSPKILKQQLQRSSEIRKTDADVIKKLDIVEASQKNFQDQMLKLENFIKNKHYEEQMVSSDIIDDHIRNPPILIFLQELLDLQRKIREKHQQLLKKYNLQSKFQQDFFSLTDIENENRAMVGFLFHELEGFSKKTNAMAIKDIIKVVENLLSKKDQIENIPGKKELENLVIFDGDRTAEL